jgi:hypothetical protein
VNNDKKKCLYIFSTVDWIYGCGTQGYEWVIVLVQGHSRGLDMHQGKMHDWKTHFIVFFNIPEGKVVGYMFIRKLAIEPLLKLRMFPVL